MNRQTLEEAIADAKTIKETAIANAMKTLEETFSPQLRATLAKKLEEMENEEEVTEELNTDLEEGIDSLDELNLEIEEEELNESEDDLYELEDDLAEADKVTEEDEIEVNPEEEENLDLENMSDEELEDLIEDVIKDMVESGMIVPGENFESEDEEMEDEDDSSEIDLEDESEIEEGKGDKMEMDEEIEQELKEIFAEEYQTEIQELKSQIASLKKENLKYKKSLFEIQNQIDEVKVLNKKLTLINEIFSTNKLSKNQSEKLILSLDEATSIKEVDLIGKIIKENLETIKNPIKENRRNFASNVITGMNKNNVRKPILEENQMLDRWEQIAGLK